MRESEAVSYIKHINDCLKKRANNSLRKEGLTLMQSHVLLKLQDAPDQRMTFKEIEKDLHVAQSTTAGLLRRLQEKNLIDCCDDPKDKRIKFCSAHCERLYWKHSRSSHRIAPGAVQRTFTCRYCGTTVTVTKAKDKRTAFCSEACRMRWFSLHRKR